VGCKKPSQECINAKTGSSEIRQDFVLVSRLELYDWHTNDSLFNGFTPLLQLTYLNHKS